MKVVHQRLSRLLPITLLVAVALGVAALTAPAGADDLNPPWWRGQFGTTSQQWQFNQPGGGPPDGFSNNPYGSPWLIPTATWSPQDFGRTGVYRSPQSLLFEIPNQPIPNDQKLIRIQATWWGDFSSTYIIVNTLPVSNQVGYSLMVLPDGWNHSTWDLVIPFNPPFEQITLSGVNLLIDQVVIDTWCVPEPGSFVALAGALTCMAAAFRRKR